MSAGRGDYSLVGNGNSAVQAGSGPASSDEAKTSGKNELGVINGVYVPCLLNILGVILFLRLPWAVGMAGWAGTFSMFVMGEVQTIFTVLSLAAIVSNGNMKGGGSYFMISRSLGPELGGSMGLLFYLSYAVGTTFYAAGVGKEIQQTWFPGQTGWTLTLCSSASLFLCLLVSLAGAGWFTKINVTLFVLLFTCVILGLLSVLFSAPRELHGGGRFEGWSASRFSANAWPEYREDDTCGGERCDFQIVFAIIFPAVTGIMEGANLSGDLKDPGRDIGRGTLYAVATAFVVYTSLMFAFGGAFERETMVNNGTIFQDVCWSSIMIVIGVLVSTGSSCLGSLFGGARILQALAKDKMFPGIGFAAWGTKGADEPMIAVLITWAIAQLCIFIGNLDVIAPIITCFFCLSYACTNLACFLVSVSGTPNFRPQFKYFSRWTCLLGFAGNLGVMIYINPMYAGVAVGGMAAIFIYLLYRAPNTHWGDVRQALIFQQVRRYLLMLDPGKQHGKTWRPSTLVLVDDARSSAVHFATSIKKGGLCILGAPVVAGKDSASVAASCTKMRDALDQYIVTRGLKAFCDVSVGSSALIAFQNLFAVAGTGAMRPNTVVAPLLQFDDAKGEAAGADQKAVVAGGSNYTAVSQQIERGLATSILRDHLNGARDFAAMVRDALAFEKNVVLCRNFPSNGGEFWPKPPPEGQTLPDGVGTLDVWIDAASTASWDSFSGEGLLMVELVHIVRRKAQRKRAAAGMGGLRVLRVVQSQLEVEAERERVEALLKEARHEAEVVIMAADGSTDGKDGTRAMNALIRQHSKDAALVLLQMPPLPAAAQAASSGIWHQNLLDLTQDLPPTAVLAVGDAAEFMSRDI